MSQIDSVPAIRVENVSKEFTYWSDPPSSLKTVLVDLMRGRLSRGERKRLQVLENVSFEVRAGEFVGIMGRNGVGKSTILKIISGIYAPTSGKVVIGGLIAPLIELGAGFHLDLSGYENIFLNSAILGFGRQATLDILQDIIDFSELGEQIHMPVKNYSSGMLVRLGFSIVVHLPAPILLMDEILAVGDLPFQEKCLAKIDMLHKKEGRTIVLVTHDPESVRRHCSRCIVISERKKLFDGSPDEGVRILTQEFAP